jgi:hypothetical protein
MDPKRVQINNPERVIIPEREMFGCIQKMWMH